MNRNDPGTHNEPVHVRSRERMRHDHDSRLAHAHHGKDKSYRVQVEDAEFRRRLDEEEWADTPGGELSLEQQYKSDGEEHNYTGPLSEFYDEYPRLGKNIDRKQIRHRNFTGIGPRGYKRTDVRIREEVCELLAQDHYIDASDIVVAVEDGVVQLSGSVRQREDRVEAELLAESVIGVEDIQNDISVRRPRREYHA